MPLPRVVIVGPFVYAVVEDPVSRDYRNRGEHDSTHVRINLDPTISEQRKRVTLTHEVIHAIFDAAGQGRVGQKFTEEEICDIFAPGLVDLLRRNPALIAYLLEDEAI